MSEVLRALEGPIAPMVCASEDPEHALVCDRTSRCTVNVLWVRIRDAIAGTLDGMTLADLVPHARRAAPIAAADPADPDAGRRPVTRLTDATDHTDHGATTLVNDDQHLVIRGLRVAPTPTASTRSCRAST